MGCGDWIMATGQARVLKAKDPKAKILIGDGRVPHWEQWFNGNPDLIDPKTLRPGDAVKWVISTAGARPYIDYDRTTPTHQVFREDYRAHPGRIVISENWRVEAERLMKIAKVKGPYVVIEPNTKGSFGGNKVWPREYWERFVRNYGREFQFVQIGAANSQGLSGVRRVATPNLMAAFAVLEKAAACVTTDGALHHACAALEVPCVTIWGARTNPKILGYPTQRNLYSGDGRNCGAIGSCEHCHAGMKAIAPEMVVKELRSCVPSA